MKETWTILKILKWTTDYFRRKGVPQPRVDAEVLLAHVLEMERLELYLHYDRPLGDHELRTYREVVRRRSLREPVQYLTSKQEFWSMEFRVNPDVLIPRPETERVVEAALHLVSKSEAHVLDLGTGSGILGIVLAKERPTWRIVAVDRSLDALAVARQNARLHGVDERIHWIAADAFTAFPSHRPLFDLIVANPPYVGDADWEKLPPEIRDYEPSLALRGGGDHGLDIPSTIVHESGKRLCRGGWLVMEMGRGQGPALVGKAESTGTYQEIRLWKDHGGIFRVFCARTMV